MRHNEDDKARKLYEAREEMSTLKEDLKADQQKIKKLEEQLKCPSKLRRLV